MVKVLYTSDIHGIESLYLQLLKKAITEHVDIVIIGGDILPKEGAFENIISIQRDFINNFLFQKLTKFKQEMKNTDIYLMLGNDDWACNLPYLEKLEKRGLLKLMDNKRLTLGNGYELIGYNFVPPTPFSIKDFEKLDVGETDYEPQRFLALVSTAKGMKEIIPKEFFQTRGCIKEDIENLPLPKNMGRAIYVLHAPPFQTKLDVLYNGRHIGSKAIKAFIGKKQPYLTLHGHIHESPQVSGSYFEKIGRTFSINPGQGNRQLHAVVFQIEDAEHTMCHTIAKFNNSE